MLRTNQQLGGATDHNVRTLLTRLQAINDETIAVMKEARATGANDLALKAITRLEKQLELEARLLGQLNETPAINIQLTPEWAQLRAAILTALEKHPEVRQAVAGVLNAGT